MEKMINESKLVYLSKLLKKGSKLIEETNPQKKEIKHKIRIINNFINKIVEGKIDKYISKMEAKVLELETKTYLNKSRR
jgi:DNA-binding protein H-NS